MNSTKRAGKVHKLGYLIPEFPGQTHIFFWREIQALRALGVDVQMISTRLGSVKKVGHAFAKEALPSTYFLYPLQLPSTLVQMLLRPVWLMRSILYALRLPEGSLSHRIKTLAFLPLAARLLAYCQKKGIGHVHGHSCANVGYILAMSALSGRLTYSLTLHGDLAVYGVNHRDKMRPASFVAAVTNPLKKDLMEIVGLSDAVSPVIWMGVDLDKFLEVPPNLTPRYLKLISVTRLAECKGHTYTLQAMKRLKQASYGFEYVIVGGGEHEQTLRHEIKALGLEQEVTFTGSLDETALVARVAAADVLLLTSVGLGEAAPVCVMEAMASGKPVIVSRIGGTADMVNNQINGYLVNQGSVDEIYAALIDLADHPQKRRDMGRAARENAVKKFSHTTQAEKLYKRIFGESEPHTLT